LIEGLSDNENIEKIEDELNDAGTLPYTYLSDDKKLTVAIRYITEWQQRNDFYNNLKPEANATVPTLICGTVHIICFIEAFN
jgi:hypothetical protein